MRIPATALSDLACEITYGAIEGCDGVMGNRNGDPDDLYKLELAIAFKRAIFSKQKRLVIEIAYPKPAP